MSKSDASKGVRHLVCRTTDTDGYGYAFAHLAMTPALADHLLEMRPVYQDVRRREDGLLCVEFFHDEVTYGGNFAGFTGFLSDWGDEWYAAPEEPVLQGSAGGRTRSAAETFKVYVTGVAWAVYATRARSFRTPEISWEGLERLAAGECPFRPAPGWPSPGPYVIKVRDRDSDQEWRAHSGPLPLDAANALYRELAYENAHLEVCMVLVGEDKL